MDTRIELKLYATLSTYTPTNADAINISRGMTIRSLIDQLGIPEEKAKLIFINGVKGNLESSLSGGEKVGIFPPVGGG